MLCSLSFVSSVAGRHTRSALGLALLQASVLLVACSSDSGDTNGGAGSAGVPGVAGGGTTSAGSGNVSGSSNGGSAGSVSMAGNATGGSATAGAGMGGTGGAGGSSAGSAGMGGASAGMGGSSAGMGGGSNEPFALKSTAFKEGDQIPLKYKCAEVNPMGENISPPLSWGPGPAGTKSYAIVLMHLPSPEHWVIWDIPASVLALPENIEHKAQPAQPAGAKQSAVNLDGFMGSGYLGPCPQMYNTPQSYQFTLYALDVETLPGLTDTSTPAQAATVVKQHLVAGSKGVTLTGTQVRM